MLVTPSLPMTGQGEVSQSAVRHAEPLIGSASSRPRTPARPHSDSITSSVHFDASLSDHTGPSRTPPLRSPQDRRVRSEGLLRSHRPSLIANKKPSVVTGGYDSSDSDSAPLPSRSPAQDPLDRRRRAHTLMSMSYGEQSGDPAAISPLRPRVRSAAGQAAYRRASPARASPLRAQSSKPDIGRGQSSRPSSQASSRKGKERASLASSLGLADGMRESALTPDQIHSLLGNSDLGAALRMMSRDTTVPEPSHHEPYLVSAPPAILDDRRERSISITVPPQRRASEMDHERRRRRSSTVVEPEGGHIPFTHHVTRVEEDDISEEEPVETAPHTEMKRSGSRLSHLFHKPKKLDPVSNYSQEKYQRDLEYRRKEQDRRESELAQERRYKALTQISAHPESERSAYRASSHLRAFYTHVYDGVDNPPRFNPLAVLRWRIKSDDQAEARNRWEAEQVDKAKQPTSFPSAWSGSPQRRSSTPRRKIRWSYTIEDVEAYKEANGVVNYFIPPRGATSEISQVSSIIEHVQELEIRPRVTSPSAVSITSPASSVAALSRSISIETNRQWKGHRSHSSLGNTNASSLANALKVPFERLNRRQRTIPSTEPPLRSTLGRPQVTDEEHHHLRKLFLKGQRVVPEQKPVQHRDDQIRALAQALQRESAFRQRQAEATRQTQLELEAAQRIQEVERELYEERSRSVMAARRRLDTIDSNIQIIDDAIRHYLAQIGQLQIVTKTSAEVELVFPGLDALRAVYDDGSPRRRWNTPPMPDLYSFGIQPWSRRTALDPTGTKRIDPISRVEVTLDHARSSHDDMIRARRAAVEVLHGLIVEVDTRIRRKDSVRAWTKAALEQSRQLQDTIDQLNRDIKGNYRARLNRWKDRQTDWVIRHVIARVAQIMIGSLYFLQFLISWLLPWRQVRLAVPKLYSWLGSFVSLAGFGVFLAVVLYFLGSSN